MFRSSSHLFLFYFYFYFCLDLKGQIDSLAKEYTANARTLSSEQKLSILRQIQQSYSKCKEFGDDKVQLAMQTYEMVGILENKHILDTCLLGENNLKNTLPCI